MQKLLKIKQNPVKIKQITSNLALNQSQSQNLKSLITKNLVKSYYSNSLLFNKSIFNFSNQSYKNPLTLKEQLELKKQAQKFGLYDQANEKDACGFGFLVNIKGKKSKKLVDQALGVLTNLTHRAAVGSDDKTGDGAGIMIQIPHQLFQKELKEKHNVDLGEPFTYGVGMIFLPQDEILRYQCEAIIEETCLEEGLQVVYWREVPVDSSVCGQIAEESRPLIQQVFIKQVENLRKSKQKPFDEQKFLKKLYLVMRQVENTYKNQKVSEEPNQQFNIVSFHNRTIVYKGLLMPEDLPKFYKDFDSPDMESAIAMIHSRFSTNTFPSWERAHPNRYLAHNGEINTIKGNVKYMSSRENMFETPLFTKEEFKKISPVCNPDFSDSGQLDNALELLLHSGRNLEESMSLLVPEAWQSNDQLDQKIKDYYKYNSLIVEPWDGPAAIAFTNGRVIGGMLDRNGLRPSRFIQTKDDLVVVASEVGCVPGINDEDIIKKDKLSSGNMILIDTEKGTLMQNNEIKASLASKRPYNEWLQHLVNLKDIEEELDYEDKIPETFTKKQLRTSQLLFGYVSEDIRTVIRPMGQLGKEAIGSMGNDTPPAVLSKRPQLIYRYFKQSFAQVTNPPIDPIRENIVMSLSIQGGRTHNLFEYGPQHCQKIEIDKPIITNAQLAAIKELKKPHLKTFTLDTTFKKSQSQTMITGDMLEQGIQDLCQYAEKAVDKGYTLLVLSDRNHDKNNVPIPMMLACAAVHNYLTTKNKRSLCSLILESAEPRDTMHMACLLGYGAIAINPYLVFEIFEQQEGEDLLEDLTAAQAAQNYITACCKGIEKIMSKVGISTLQSYKGSQIFEAIGINQSIIDQYFTGTVSKISGIGIDDLAQDINTRYQQAFESQQSLSNQNLPKSGELSWTKKGEKHQINPSTLFTIQEAVRTNSYEKYKEFSQISNNSSKQSYTIRGLFNFKKINKHSALPIEDVEPIENIVKRFRTGAMSYGSISQEAHETIAEAMNILGGRSNCGEGGEHSSRYNTIKNSAIKQVASGRFGVTSNYLQHCDEIQIKMAQGAKPGEGGHLPGFKVDENIASLRYSTPGVDLISPPPHHDIYSIEDLSQLIFDLKNANDKAQISVKLVSEAGVGTVAAGVAKAQANSIVISGDQGGTGASPITSITNAGTPWEIGLAEAHQTLLVNGLRNQVTLETDGGLKTGRDVAIAAMLGADQYGFGTIALISTGCIMMRQCHLNTCPVGVATQDKELRKKFKGKPEHVVNYFRFVAQEIREIMAELGIRKFEQLIGRTDLLETQSAITHFKKVNQLDLSPILNKLQLPNKQLKLHFTEHKKTDLSQILDQKIIQDAQEAIENKQPVNLEYNITNTDRTVCTKLSSVISQKYGEQGLPENTINLTFTGSCGQSFGAFMTKGIKCTVYGDANDYVGKGLCGGEIIVRPNKKSTLIPYENSIVGNVCLFGATSGKAFFYGNAGERFAVRNSGVTAVVENIGDHGCEYMTGGKIVVLGQTGRNFGAGMSGGMAFIYDKEDEFMYKGLCNQGNVQVETPEKEDIEFLKQIIQEYLEKTDSITAKDILDNWDNSIQRFVKVISPEYKKAIALQQKKKYRIDKLSKEQLQKDSYKTISQQDTLNRSIQERIKDFKEVEKLLGEEKSQDQASRCMDCGVPFCHKGCPLGNSIPDFNHFVNEGRWDMAYKTLSKTNNFPEMTGRLCPAPCEDICTRNIDGAPVNIRHIERQVSQQAKEEGLLLKPQISKTKTQKNIAIIGSGPAGMACAQQLARKGHSVTVYERDDRFGGLLRYGIPSFKMEKHIIDRRLRQMQKEGVVFEANVNVGKDITEQDLYKQYDAVVMATGAQQPRDMPIEGRKNKGVYQAMEYLVQQNKQNHGDEIEDMITAKDKNVIVIGGGDTGSDCIGTAIRQGAQSVTQIAYTPKPLVNLNEDILWFDQKMKLKTSTSHEEGAERDWSVLTKQFLADEVGQVTGVKLARLEPIDKRVNGKRIIKEIPDSEFTMDAELILLAVGFLGPELNQPLMKQLQVQINQRGTIGTDSDFMTNVPGIFACGDCNRGQSLLVWAIAEGRNTAEKVHKYLESNNSLRQIEQNQDQQQKQQINIQ